MSQASTAWTEKRVERLKTLWAEGLSASHIAAELEVSRNAIIGKVHRLGLSGRANQPPVSTSAPHLTRVQARRLPRPKIDPVTTPFACGSLAVALAPGHATEPEIDLAETAEVVPMARYLTLHELDARSCRWPIGDPTSPDFRFCGAPTASGQPYCTACARKAYRWAPRPSRPSVQQQWCGDPFRRFGVLARRG